MIFKTIYSSILCLLITAPALATNPPVAAIASAHPLATEAGMEILREGGNAFDAAVAVSAVLDVVEPYHTGLGGGGFWLLHDAKHKVDKVLDAREVAPLAANKNMYIDKNGVAQQDKSLRGALSAAIPGEPAALAEVASRYGKLGLAKDLAPAIRIARDGFKVTKIYQRFAKMQLGALQRYPSTAAIFLENNKVPVLNKLIRQPELADTLTQLAKLGKDGFYQGQIAKKLVKDVQANGGIWSLQDLKRYHVIWRNPLRGRYKNIAITTVPLPSGGGIGLITILNILAPYQLDRLDFTHRAHVIIEAMRLAYWDRVKDLGDPAFIHVSVADLISTIHANYLRQFIKVNRATPSADFPHPEINIEKPHHTTHFSILDREGNRVAATITTNYLFGSAYVAKGTGVLLNDEMDDFAIKTGVPNVFGLIGGLANSIQPGKRPLSSSAPVFLETKDRLAILGTPGGSRIPTMVLLATLDFAQNHLPESWVGLPRYHHQYYPDVVEYESNAFTPRQIRELKAMGYHFQLVPLPYGNMQAVLWNKKEGWVKAASDPRGIGLAKTQ